MKTTKTTIVDCVLGDVTIPVTVFTSVLTKYGMVPDYVSWMIIKNATFYESVVVQDVYDTLKPGDLFVDVGANLGQYSAAAKHKGASVIAVEPQVVLKEPLEANVGDGTIHWVGVGQCEAELELSYAFMKNPDTGSLMANIGANDLRGGNEAGRFPSGIKVPVVTLDSLIGKQVPTVIKVDVERMEYDVLLGSKELLKHKPVLYLEQNEMDNFTECYNFLQEYGYTIARIFNADGTVVVKYV